MSVGTTAAILIGGGLAAGGGIGSALIGKSAASKASTQQANAYGQGIDEINQTTQQARDALNKGYDTSASLLSPWIQGGAGALQQLIQGTQPGGALTTPFGETYQTPAAFSYGAFDPGAAFTAPTGVTQENDPGYQFRIQQSNQALERAAAASGGAFSGGTAEALAQNAQNYASNEYQNVYNRALNSYQTNFADRLNAYGTNFANAYNTYNTNVNTGLNAYNTRANAYNTAQSNAFNRLAALTGIGQSATGALVGQNADTARTIAQILSGQGTNIANLLTGQGNAMAQGTLGQAQALNTGVNALFGGMGGAISSAGLLKMLTGGGGGTGLLGAGAEGPIYNQLPNLSGSSYQAGDD